MGRDIVSEVVIDAPPAAVWEVLSGFERYPQWNPFIQAISGEQAVGARLSVQLRIGRRRLEFRPQLLAWQPEREMRWLGRVLLPGLLDGEHGFRLEPVEGGRTWLIQSEHFSGFLVPLLMGRAMMRDTRSAFMAMNAALKGTTEGYVA